MYSCSTLCSETRPFYIETARLQSFSAPFVIIANIERISGLRKLGIFSLFDGNAAYRKKWEGLDLLLMLLNLNTPAVAI